MGFQSHVTCARTLRRGRRMTKSQASAPLPHRVTRADSATAILRSADTKLRGRFCVKRCGPIYRRVRNASAALKNFVATSKRLFQHNPIESGLVSMIGMSHFPTGGSIASLRRFLIFLLSSLGPLCPLLSNSLARAFCAFGTPASFLGGVVRFGRGHRDCFQKDRRKVR